MMPERAIAEKSTEQNKVVSLFQYIKELNKLKQKAILNITDYPWARTLSSIPDDPENISIFYRDRVEIEDTVTADDSVLLSIHKPEFDGCPQPDSMLSNWLEDGWDSFPNDVQVKEKIAIRPAGAKKSTVPQLGIALQDDGSEKFEYFVDDPQRIDLYNAWLKERVVWVERQKVILRTRNLFADLYRLYFELQRDSETMELVVANGILCDRNNPSLRHPVLTKRVKLNYNPAENIVFIEEVESSSELYAIAFQTMDDINLSAINQLQEDLQKNDYHPLDRNDTPSFLKVLVHQLSSDSRFSEEGVPEKWMSTNRLLMYTDPCYIMRKRIDGTLKAIEQIIENVQETGYVPAPIREIVSGGKIEPPKDTEEETLEEQLASVGGESFDVLLSKEANKEQLEIAKRIELYNAVLVQGPPGTGKTHTIANLMGHFLAQGKSVLVTSQTPKALSVLKEKVAPGLQNLCVSVLEDSNVDMERSIDGITDYMSKTTSHELRQELDRLASERKEVIRDLASVRRKIFRIINQECNCIVYNGEEISPSKAAAFVLEHTEDLSYIPGKVRLDVPLPLSFAELTDLYRSNEGISVQDEAELATTLPSPEELISPTDFSKVCETLRTESNRLQALSDKSKWSVSRDKEHGYIIFASSTQRFSIPVPEKSDVEQLRYYLLSLGDFQPWMIYASVDGKNGGAYRNRWELLIQKIQQTCEFAESTLGEQFGHVIRFADNCNLQALNAPISKLKSIFEQKGKISKFTLMLNKDLVPVLEEVTFDGNAVQSVKDCEIILHIIELEALRSQCSVYWNELLAIHGVPRFETLATEEPERIAKRWLPNITRFLGWYQNEYATLISRLQAIAISPDTIFLADALNSDVVKTEKMLSSLSTEFPIICDVCNAVIEIDKTENRLLDNHRILRKGKRVNSKLCILLEKANTSRNTTQYIEVFTKLERMHQKYTLQERRKEMLAMLEPIAPQWAEAIKCRDGIHGQSVLPSSIEEAWKWKQLSAMIEDMTAMPFRDLQKESIRLSKEYRKITASYVEKSAWYHLLLETEGDIDMRHALQGWKQTVKKIGKGTGKNAPALKAKARELMSRCQVAVPSWIMPINRALESLNPKENRFDIVIIDEASQSDVSSLAILYMGRKLIIVGDDKQVSPMAVGVEIDKLNALQQMYIQGKIPNAHLYDAKTSIYDIAKTTFQPLMLREHFRCVPEIIGFSNMLSYDYKIKPLRDASNSILLPAVVNYRVADGERLNNKTNPNEAKAIVALMQACMELPEYAKKSFGIISLLGDEQVKIIQRLIEEKIDHKDLIGRNILCGNASHFQGDERDIIFLSVVDSGNGKGPVHLQGFGPDDAFRKRYNVAASRARDQLWVVDSLDAATDLKPGDIRKILIDYSLNPKALELKHTEIEEKADSPFEVAVAQTLVDRGYHLVQQWKVGAYRLDMVAVCGKKTVAIECDGERYHSGEAKIREDMERQTILERLGWRFIRIRGSEYFRNPEKTMERVIDELSAFGIVPENTGSQEPHADDCELLNRIKQRAAQILLAGQPDDAVDLGTIAIALDTKSIVPDIEPKPIGSEENIQGGTQELNSVKITSVPPTHEVSKSTSDASNVRKEAKTSAKNESKTDVQQMTLPGMENSNDAFDIIAELKNAGISYIDKRKNGGSLWIVGGNELSKFVAECRCNGVKFTFKADGGKTTKGKPGWWTK
ncbi:MAG: AAA family ATPase [Syntrophomonadaceae bacterium]|nr:AAA family ATPase [Syntrophomonadaceae bacterium]